MWIWWAYTEKKKLNIFVLDKTVLNQTYQEHISFYWVLNKFRFVNNEGNKYSPEKDYYGFFQDGKGGYSIKDLESKSTQVLEKLADDYDMVYYTDLYGIYWDEWYNEYPHIKPELTPGKIGERSELIYGGLTKNELEFIKLMKLKKKLIINEFNIIASPTQNYIREEYEKEFDMKWLSWVGRYFDNLDTAVNKELPRWLIRNYKEQNNNQWPFTKSGIVFVRNDDKIVILENKTHLEKEVPYIYTSNDYAEYFKVAPEIKYPFWFDICSTGL